MGILSLEFGAPYLLTTMLTMRGGATMRSWVATVCLMAGGCAVPQAHGAAAIPLSNDSEVQSPAAEQSGETITFALNSWGRPLAWWQVNEDGAGILWRITTKEPFGDYDVAKYRFSLPDEAGVPFVSATEEVRAVAIKGLDCRREIADMPYGTITWTYPAAQRRLDFDFGCTSESSGKVYQAMARATEVIEKMAKLEPQPFEIDHYVRGHLTTVKP